MPESEAMSMGRNVSIGGLADAIMETLEDYADLAAEDVKQAVKEAGDTVRDEIRTHAPKDTGEYAKSWAVKKMKETSNSLTVVVHSRNRYQLAHLLEFGHAKRGGCRVSAQPHIAAAEAKGMEQLEEEIRKALEGSDGETNFNYKRNGNSLCL